MALGFGFNKAKVLSTAEKFVQQGKLQNAIAEYEKILKLDPRDLTVLNTIGDLYARLGRNDRAADFFRKVGDAYATDGFVVKAIAMYKKLTKLNLANNDCAVRLAELYTQQGLYNDARAQYTAIADQYLKANDRESATGILKKMLDLDPENAVMQAKVADLYLKLGKNKEALDIYFASAQALYQRGTMDAADEALAQILKLDSRYAPALLLRGQIAAETGNSELTIENLSKVPDLDSHPEALRPLLQSYLKTGNLEQAEPILNKLITAHNDLSGISSYAEALFAAAQPEEALHIYSKYADTLLKSNAESFMASLTAAVSKIKDSAPALKAMLPLLQKAHAEGHAVHEVQELLGNAYVQAGELQKGADLYKELSETEPDNPLHEQNYKQVVARMGTDAVTRTLTEEEGGQALMVDELETPPAFAQEYPGDLAEAISSALTDAELFSSYNVPDKAIKPLEDVLPKAPNDIRVRQRLAALYARVGRFADAANCCTALAEVHSGAGLDDQAQQFRQMAQKYSGQASGVPASAPILPVKPAGVAAQMVSTPPSNEAIAFQASSATAEFAVDAPAAEPIAAEPTVAEVDLSSSTIEHLPEHLPAATAEPEAESSDNWEEMLTVEAPPTGASAAGQASTTESGEGAVQEITAEETPDEILEEARFYLAQRMMAEAESAITRLEAVAHNHPELDSLRSSAAAAVAAQERESAKVPKESAPEVTKVKAADHKPERPKAKQEHAAVSSDDEDILDEIGAEELEESAVDELMPEIAAGEPASFTAPPTHIPPPARAGSPAATAKPAAAQAAASPNPLSGMLSDLEDVLDQVAPTAAAKSNTPAPAPAKIPAPARSTAASAPAVLASPIQANPQEAQSMLSDLLDEFKEEVEEPAADTGDPDTHYNLGVAFREMGLLDEAIGELQKVCRAVDDGAPFSQSMQAYTWLAQCLVDKGAPQAAIRWYEKALRIGGIGEDSRLAVYYDMANAFEAAGNTKAALDNFMEVYGHNIDYRDVAERIRSLRK
jgi:tetratricopeptide (TPR) repeat protein